MNHLLLCYMALSKSCNKYAVVYFLSFDIIISFFSIHFSHFFFDSLCLFFFITKCYTVETFLWHKHKHWVYSLFNLSWYRTSVSIWNLNDCWKLKSKRPLKCWFCWFYVQNFYLEENSGFLLTAISNLMSKYNSIDF